MQIKTLLTFLIIPVSFLFFFSGCADFDTIADKTEYQCQTVDECVKCSDYKRADIIIEQAAKEQDGKKGNNRILYYMDKGSIQQIMGNYKESSKSLHEAEAIISELYTKSVTAEVSSFLSNDLSLPYEGEDFEQVMVHVLKALNFMYSSDYEGARVEARKVDSRLNQIGDKMEGQNVYKQDALARYISGFAYEAQGEINNAYIDYKKAYEAYLQYSQNYGSTVPDAIKKDLLRLSEALGFNDQYEAYKNEFGFMPYTKQDDLKGKGEVIFVFYDGQAPDKVDKGDMTPMFVDKGAVMASAEITTEEDKTYNSYIIEDVTSIAVKNLAQKMDLIQAKNLARGIVKEVVGEVAKQGLKEILKNTGFGFLADTAVDAMKNASDLADTRSWKTLPGRFHMIRLPVSGTQSVKLRMYMRDGTQREKVFKINVKPGKKKAIPVYCFL